MPKLTSHPELNLDPQIAFLRKEVQQLKADREYMEVRVSDVCREIDALVAHFVASKVSKQKSESDTSGSPSPDPERRNSISLSNLDQMTEVAQRHIFSKSSFTISDTLSLPGTKEMGPPSCPPLFRSQHSSPNARINRKRVLPLDEVSRICSTSYLRAENARNRSDSQQSLPDTISKDTHQRGLLIRAKSGEIRAATKMSLSSSSPALTCKDPTGSSSPYPMTDRKDSILSQLSSKTCTDL